MHAIPKYFTQPPIQPLTEQISAIQADCLGDKFLEYDSSAAPQAKRNPFSRALVCSQNFTSI